jgi:hypothetical protein
MERKTGGERMNVNKIGLRVIMVIALVMTVIACEEDLVREELYFVKILSITPDLVDGVEQQLTVTVEYKVQLSHVPAGLQLIIAFNTEELDDYKVHGYTSRGIWDPSYIEQNPSGTYKFNVTVTPKDWSPHGEFQAAAYLGYVSYVDGYVSGVTDTLISDTKTFPVSDNYWTIAWDLNGGMKKGISYYDPEGVYPARVVKGAVLAKPSPWPIKEDYYLGGWYTDSALTQKYDFAGRVSSDLNLYAKWGDITVEDLYGTWKAEDSPYGGFSYTLTITANSVKWVMSARYNGGYLQYTNVRWAQQPTASNSTAYPRGYTFTGIREYDLSVRPPDIGFIALSPYGQAVGIKKDPTTSAGDIPSVYYAQE